MEVAKNAHDHGDSDMQHKLASIRGVLNWVVCEESGFGDLLEDWRNIDKRHAARKRAQRQ